MGTHIYIDISYLLVYVLTAFFSACTLVGNCLCFFSHVGFDRITIYTFSSESSFDDMMCFYTLHFLGVMVSAYTLIELVYNIIISGS